MSALFVVRLPFQTKGLILKKLSGATTESRFPLSMRTTAFMAVVSHCYWSTTARPSDPEAPEGQPSARKAGVTWKARGSPRRASGSSLVFRSKGLLERSRGPFFVVFYFFWRLIVNICVKFATNFYGHNPSRGFEVATPSACGAPCCRNNLYSANHNKRWWTSRHHQST